MKTLKPLIAINLLILLLAGCGEESNKSVFKDSQTDGIYTLSKGDQSEILPGDKLEPTDDATEIEVIHTLDDDTKHVTILEGSATLLRGRYAAQ